MMHKSVREIIIQLYFTITGKQIWVLNCHVHMIFLSNKIFPVQPFELHSNFSSFLFNPKKTLHESLRISIYFGMLHMQIYTALSTSAISQATKMYPIHKF
jgi:hypothetical protein